MKVIIISPTKKNAKHVAAYVRVSTLQEEQKESIVNQTAYYETYIKTVPHWQFAGIYADHGLSGRDVKHRLEFNKMIQDALEGKIDVILVKSISRFSRNVVDAQKYVQLLRRHNVEILFDEENLSSFNRNTELALNMLTLCAEQESKSISENVRWTYQRMAKQGLRHLGNNSVLGYDEIGGKLVPNEKADTIRFIFESYAAGLSIRAVIERLYLRGEKTMRGKERFNPGVISYILHNEIYVGDRLIQKQAPKNFYTKKPNPAKEYDSFYLRDNHEPIITREVWDAVQARLHT